MIHNLITKLREAIFGVHDHTDVRVQAELENFERAVDRLTTRLDEIQRSPNPVDALAKRMKEYHREQSRALH